MLFKGNNNPGPQQYNNQSGNFNAKTWQTNIGAFGTTEKKFASLHHENSMPGPGAYKSDSFVPKKFTTRKVKGQKMRVNSTK